MNSNSIPRRLLKLKRDLRREEITNAAIADASGVTPSMVSKVLNGRAKSSRVMATVEAMRRRTLPAPEAVNA